MTPDREWIDQNLAAYALGALEADESARMESLLARDTERACMLEEFRVTLDALPLVLEPIEPPPELRERVLARVRAERRAPHFPRRAKFLLAAAAALVIAVGAWNVVLWRKLERARENGARDAFASIAEGRVVLLAGTGAPGAQGRIVVAPDGQTGKLVVAGLSPLARDRVYQLWFVRKGATAPDSGGTFTVDERGHAILDVRPTAAVDDLVAIAVTEEPAPGLPAPTGKHLLDVVR